MTMAGFLLTVNYTCFLVVLRLTSAHHRHLSALRQLVSITKFLVATAVTSLHGESVLSCTDGTEGWCNWWREQAAKFQASASIHWPVMTWVLTTQASQVSICMNSKQFNHLFITDWWLSDDDVPVWNNRVSHPCYPVSLRQLCNCWHVKLLITEVQNILFKLYAYNLRPENGEGLLFNKLSNISSTSCRIPTHF